MTSAGDLGSLVVAHRTALRLHLIAMQSGAHVQIVHY